MSYGASGLPKLHLNGDRFVDTSGRTVLLRGVNLGGDSKMPWPDGNTRHPADFSQYRQVSFIDRPFPLAEAEEHFGRLRHWGFNCLRLLTTWEAIEHAGPGQHDEAYLDYYAKLCELAGEYGFYVYVDFHQDVWSRMTGGDGAPGWTLPCMGMDIARLDACDAAFTMQARLDYGDPRPRQPEKYPQMSWFTNYSRPANGIAWTLFFGGRDFAPQFRVEGQNIQDYLQSHFIGSQVALAKRIAHLPHVLGFDLLNEPSRGWIGRHISRRPLGQNGDQAMPGIAWSPLDALRVVAGQSMSLPLMGVSKRKLGIALVGERQVNPQALCLWLQGYDDPFAAAGAYELDDKGSVRSVRDDFFSKVGDRSVDYTHDYLKPFQCRAAAALHEINPDWFMFLEAEPMNPDHAGFFASGLPAHAVNAGHWYDVTTLLLKRFLHPVGFNLVRGKLLLGEKQRRADYRRDLDDLAKPASAAGVPTLVGEFGIPYDLQGGKAYQRFSAAGLASSHTGRVWRQHEQALGLMYDAMDELGLSCTQWNYTASNRNDLRVGDGWNQEDLSIFSRDQYTDHGGPDSGGRAVHGFVRPYARFIQGRLQKMSFDRKRNQFELIFLADTTIPQPTELFVPNRYFPGGVVIEAEGLTVEQDNTQQLMRLWAMGSGERRVRLFPAK